MAEIALSQGCVTTVDDDLFDWLRQWKWSAATSHCGLTYAVRCAQFNGISTRFFLHRVIALPPEGAMVDHINGDGLDNRRANLRWATPWQNAVNARVPVGASGYRGVEPLRDRRRTYHARIKVRGRMISLGSAPTAEGAARLYDAAARQHFGEFAVLNFPDDEATA